MKQVITALSIALLLTGCVQNQHRVANPSKLSWATADFRKIENKIYKIVERKNPYPDASMNKREIQNERSHISREIRRIKKDICNTRNSKQTNAYRNNQNCHSKAESSPRIIELSKQKREIDRLSNNFYDHSDKLRAFAKEQTTSIIQRYSQGKFEVVVRQNRDAIIYNKTGIAIDITDALMHEIDESKLMMSNE